MLKLNDTVLYGATGVCTVSDIEEKKIGKLIKKYYVLKPVANSSATIYLPTDNEVLLGKVRRPLSKSEIEALLLRLKSDNDIWIDDEDQRKLRFSEMILSKDRMDCLRVLKALKSYQLKLSKQGKKFHISDDRILKEAERLIYDEFSFVLKIDRLKAEEFLLARI